MPFTQTDLEYITRMAAAALSIDDIADVLTVPRDELQSQFDDQNSAVFQAYRKGHLSTLLATNERIIKDAQNGSGPAQVMVRKMLDDAQLKHAMKL
jgi:hypothetical protein